MSTVAIVLIVLAAIFIVALLAFLIAPPRQAHDEFETSGPDEPTLMLDLPDRLPATGRFTRETEAGRLTR